MKDLITSCNQYNVYRNKKYHNPSFNGVDKHSKRNTYVNNYNILNSNVKSDNVSITSKAAPQSGKEQPILSDLSKEVLCVGIITALAIAVDFLFFKGKHVDKMLNKLKSNKKY